MKLWVGVLRKLGVVAVLFGGVAVGTTALSVATAQVAVAQAIVVQGNQRVEADTIRSYFHGRDAASIDEGLKALYATGLFEDIRTSTSGGRLVITVVEAPVINRVAFEGNRKVKDEQLALEVQSKTRGTLSRPIVQSDVQRIVEIYRQNGRYNVRVDPKIISQPNNRVDLVFEINEGDKTGIKDIRFIGNRAFSEGRLKDVIKTRETGILSFLKSNDIYDADRVEADRELLRRFYLKNGYADVRVLSAVTEYDPGQGGFLITFTIEEGEQYKFGTVDVLSNVRDIDPAEFRAKVRTSSGSVYNADLVEKTVEDMTIEASKRGYAFAQVRPRGDRDFQNRIINVTYTVEEGARVYIERINIRGNTRTRDYVIRREFDIAEGDAYNRVLIDRAERRLKNLNYFKTVKISNEPGSAPDRIVLVVDVEEQSTGEFSVAGGYSTADGFIGEVSVAERNLLGRGQFAKATAMYGERSHGFDISFVEPYFLGYRLSAGFDIFMKQTTDSQYQSYESRIAGGTIKFGLPLREDLSLQLRYSGYQQEITLADYYNCWPAGPNCQPASAAIRSVANAGEQFVSSIGYSLIYNTLDNNRNPTSGLYAELRQDFAGVGGDVNFLKTTGDARYYYEVMSDLVAMFRAQGGHVTSWGDKDLRLLDHFFAGPNIVRGFAPSGIGPRDITSDTYQDALGGTMYWGVTAELQFPLFGVSRDFGLKGAIFADAGSAWNYDGPLAFVSGNGVQTIDLADSSAIRSSVGASLIWDSPFGPLRFDYAYAITKEDYDRTQAFRFSGGTKF